MSKFNKKIMIELSKIIVKSFEERDPFNVDSLVLSGDTLKEITYYKDIINRIDMWFIRENIVAPKCVDTDAESYEEALRNININDFDCVNDANDEVEEQFKQIKNQIDINNEIIAEHQDVIDDLNEENEKLEELLSNSFRFPRDEDDDEYNEDEDYNEDDEYNEDEDEYYNEDEEYDDEDDEYDY